MALLFAQLADVGTEQLWLLVLTIGLGSPLLGYLGNWLWHRPRRGGGLTIAIYYGAAIATVGLASLIGDVVFLVLLLLALVGPFVGLVVLMKKPNARW